MKDEKTEFKKELDVKWVKAPSGNTYLCPVASLERLGDKSEKSLKTICVEESGNPQNE